jgi:ankyrin repeat protein
MAKRYNLLSLIAFFPSLALMFIGNPFALLAALLIGLIVMAEIRFFCNLHVHRLRKKSYAGNSTFHTAYGLTIAMITLIGIFVVRELWFARPGSALTGVILFYLPILTPIAWGFGYSFGMIYEKPINQKIKNRILSEYPEKEKTDKGQVHETANLLPNAKIKTLMYLTLFAIAFLIYQIIDNSVPSAPRQDWPEIYNAVRNEEIGTVKKLLDEGVDVNTRGGRPGRTLLHAAIFKNNASLIHLLIERGADVQAQDRYSGKTPLHLAACANHVHLCKIFIEAGAEIDVRSKGGLTPLYSAVHKGQLEAAEYLIKNGADVNAAGSNGWTPLMEAVNYHYKSIVKLLLESGADPNLRSGNGKTALSIASGISYRSIKKMLLEYKVLK